MQFSYELRPRAKVTKYTDEDEDYDPRTETLDNERDDAQDTYITMNVGSSTIVPKKRKRAGRGEKASKRSKTQADAEPLAAPPATVSLAGMLNLPLDVILVVRPKKSRLVRLCIVNAVYSFTDTISLNAI